MEERLNNYEKSVLLYIKKRYEVKYSIKVSIDRNECGIEAKIDNEILDNILEGLCVRDYISFQNLKINPTCSTIMVSLKEKALNFINH